MTAADHNTPQDAASGEASCNVHNKRKLALDSMRKSLAGGQRKPRHLPWAFGGLGLVGILLFVATHNGADPAVSQLLVDTHIDETAAPRAAELDPSRQRAAQAAPVQPVNGASGSQAQPDPEVMRQRELDAQMRAKQAADEERMRQVRLKSAISPDGSDAGEGGPAPSGAAAPADSGSLLGERPRGPQDTNSEFARSVAGNTGYVVKAGKIDHLECKILQGKVLDAKLLPRTTSDLPGTLTAMVDRDVYGEQGRIALLPWGTRLIGTPNSSVRKGQERVFIVWTRAIRPDGVTVTLDSYAADQLGTAGMGGDVNLHAGQILGMSVLLSLLSAGSSTVGVSPADQMNSIATYRQSVQSSLAQASQQLLQGYANIPPTITVPHGSRVRILVNRDLDMTGQCAGPSEDD